MTRTYFVHHILIRGANFFGANKIYEKRLRGTKISMENLRGTKISVENLKGYEKFAPFSEKHSNRVSGLRKDRRPIL